ncbi:Gamma-glutamylputrescine oxidoreductase [Pelagimonas phthalicica]|uniref:Gamma-glutamylputrescine oxidoreductase n=1 Tax=Pelagimonas phthalicica TaxID=1037362 RepID=A0A238JBG7_9RHOB|nr:FAD-binding oxidoreductase [Pelagimonas phthalicica]TDS93712.1 gamma-glutamylputrescine oxidase [Pelagimonas phthalicica]SMX27765.1 Gamma-glutamylputrescine oxidoreductase [Pelagimonas phthalicica]
MNLLFANDKRGAFPASWYAATAGDAPDYDRLRGETRADVCIIGGGFTGLSAALHLAEAGLDVALLEAHRVGFGASGRNGGQLGSGQRQDQQELERMIGRDAARRMWELGQDAKALVRDLVVKHQIECALKDGVAWAASSEKSRRWTHDYAAFLQERYDYPIEALDAADFAQICPSPDYQGGMLDMGAAHLHPLRLAQGLARAAHTAGARIFEHAHVHDVNPNAAGKIRIATDQGHVLADHLIYACNGYLGGLERKVAARVMPINNFIVATEPLGARAAEVLTRDIAVADDRFVVNYFRLSEDKRLLFGGGESYGYRFPSDIRAVVSKPMLQVFPGLRDVKLDYAWGGTLAITMKRMPYLARLAPNILSASGYSGHGLGNAIQAGKLMAEAVRGQSAGFDAFAALPTTRFPGGAGFRTPLLSLAMSWYAMRDRLGF